VATPIIADFLAIVQRPDGQRARPESALPWPRHTIESALWRELAAPGLLAAQIDALVRALGELETFVPDADAALVCAYQQALAAPGASPEALSPLLRSDQPRAEAICKRIAEAQDQVAIRVSRVRGEGRYSLKADLIFPTILSAVLYLGECFAALRRLRFTSDPHVLLLLLSWPCVVIVLLPPTVIALIRRVRSNPRWPDDYHALTMVVMSNIILTQLVLGLLWLLS
jgi:hypothetical protein